MNTDAQPSRSSADRFCVFRNGHRICYRVQGNSDNAPLLLDHLEIDRAHLVGQPANSTLLRLVRPPAKTRDQARGPTRVLCVKSVPY